MIPVLVAFVGGLVTLLPTLVTTRRRRLLHLLREEAAVLDALKSDVAKEHLEKALENTAYQYSQRARGLDARDRAIRRMWLSVPFSYVFLFGGFFVGSDEHPALKKRLGLNHDEALAMKWTMIGIAFVITFTFIGLSLRQALLARKERLRRHAREAEEAAHQAISDAAARYDPAD